MFHRAQLRRIGVVPLLALVATLFTGIFAVPAKAAPPLELQAQAAVLLDYTTGQVLFEKNPDQVIPPASLTKLMTLHLAYKKLAEGKMKREDLVQVRPEAWSAKFQDSSLMFLEPGQKVTVGEIMKGVAVPSGNDASVALAQHIAGSVDSFVKMMNDEARAMGYQNLTFVDPHGLSPENKVTAREFADFARRYTQLHPEALEELHNQKTFEYPKYENLPEERKAGLKPEQHRPISQDNRNGLLWTFEGVDGLKTGYVDEAGFNIALTAKRGEMRLVGVILGVQAPSIPEGTAKREQDGAALLSWGFNNFVTEKPALPEIKPVRVWKGAANQVNLKPAQEVLLTLEKGAQKSLTATVHQEESVIAPVQAGQKLGELIFAANGSEVARFPLVAADAVEQGGFFKRLWDSLRLLVAGWLKR
ncbi:MAG: D-alanyl-D-alanine carboxypeptidase family protein [Bacillota bacterium]